MVEDDDAAMLAAWRRGDRAAGDRLLRRYVELMRGFFRRRVDGNADDLVQQALLACIEGRDRIREDDAFRRFALGVARNLVRMHMRRRVHISMEECTDAMPCPGLGPDDRLERSSRERALLGALEQLTVSHRTVVAMHWWQRLSAGAIASRLALPEPTVRSRLRRARLALRAHLDCDAIPRAS
jgi:RNA polymerase sigma-70 factor (ECF subfamily)